MTRPRIPKQADVGLLAGVSRATVSQVLNNKAGFLVPQETRQRVFDAAQELGYVPNASARNLRSQKTSTIGATVVPRESARGPVRPANASEPSARDGGPSMRENPSARK